MNNTQLLTQILAHTNIITAPEDLAGRVAATLNEHPQLKQYVLDTHGDYINAEVERLSQCLEHSYHQFDGFYKTATAIDAGDALFSLVELGFAIPSFGGSELVSAVTAELIESLPKLGFAAYVAKSLHDWRTGAYVGGLELASMIPILGDFIDIAPVYRWGVGRSIRKQSAQLYLEQK